MKNKKALIAVVVSVILLAAGIVIPVFSGVEAYVDEGGGRYEMEEDKIIYIPEGGGEKGVKVYVTPLP